MSIAQSNTADTQSSPDRSVTEGVIRDLYTLAAFYTAHPGLPRPESIDTVAYVDTDAEVDRLAGLYDGHPARGDYTYQFGVNIGECASRVRLVICCYHPDRTAR